MEMHILRTRAERRKNNWKKAKRQVRIEHDTDGTWGEPSLLKHIHAYVKENVPYANPYDKYNNTPSIADKRKIDSQDLQLDEEKNF